MKPHNVSRHMYKDKISRDIIINDRPFKIIYPITLERNPISQESIYVPLDKKDFNQIVFMLKAKKKGLQCIFVRFY